MKIVHIAGARPNFMKIAPILREMGKYPGFQSIFVHTGQHYDENMSEIFFRDLGLPQPDINLGVGSGSHAAQTAQIMMRFEPLLIEHKPDLVLVVGDVNSTLACSLVAAKLQIPVAHVEAGVRSFDRSMPEEINRVVTDALAEYLFTPSQDANQNLLDEGVLEKNIHFVGNVMVDSLVSALRVARTRRSWAKFGLSPGDYGVVTLHRVSNVDHISTLRELLSSLKQVAQRIPLIFPVHPRTLNRLNNWEFSKLLTGDSRITLVEPLGYLDFLCMLADSRLVLTDSGGIQAETTILGVPCLTLRENTEWPVTIVQGTNRLVGTDRNQILSGLDEILSSQETRSAQPEGWDGKAAERIVQVFLDRTTS